MTEVSLTKLVTAVGSGQAVASFPTDTVPGLAALPTAAALLYAVKQRRLDKPLILLAATIDDVWPYVAGTLAEQTLWRSLMTNYWPGALTLVLPASASVPPGINLHQPGTIGVRIPDHPIAQTILSATGPLATTSANLSGQPALLTMAAIAQAFPAVLQLEPSAAAAIGDRPGSGQASTVVRWTGTGWEMLRSGAVILPSVPQH
jgi:L-threonylcarbamoyladenylate synthase